MPKPKIQMLNIDTFMKDLLLFLYLLLLYHITAENATAKYGNKNGAVAIEV